MTRSQVDEPQMARKSSNFVHESKQRDRVEGNPLARSARDAGHGREPEMERISEILQYVATSRVSCELRISGPQGVGKTWLLSKVEKAAVRLGFELRRAGPHQGPRSLVGEPADAPTTRPLLISVDNAHTWDPHLLALDRLATQPHSQLRVMAWRTGEHPDHREGLPEYGAPDVFDLPLGPLPEHAVCNAAADILGTVPGDRLMSLLACVNGNPGALFDLVHGLCHDGLIESDGDQADLTTHELPQRFVTMVSRAAGALSERTREVLMTAAVLGRESEAEDIAHFLGVPVAGLTNAFVEASHARIMSAESEMVTFRHEPVRQALLRAAPVSMKKALHRQAADMLLARGGSTLSASRHLASGARHGDAHAVAVLLRAAQEVVRDSPREAMKLATRGRELASPQDDRQPLLVSVGMEAHIRSGFPVRAIELASAAPSTGPESQAGILYWLSVALSMSGCPQQGSAIARSLLTEPHIPLDLRRELAISERLGNAMTAGPATAPETARAEGAAIGVHGLPLGIELTLTAIEQWRQGRVTQALSSCREAVRCDDQGSWLPVCARSLLVTFLASLRETSEARAVLAESNPVSSKTTDVAVLLANARLELAEDDPDDAATEAVTVLAEFDGAMENSPLTWQVLTTLAIISLRQGYLTRLTEYRDWMRTLRRDRSTWRWSAVDSWLETQIAAAQGDRAALLNALDEVERDEGALLVLLIEEPAAAAWLTRAFLAVGAPERAAAVAGTMNRLAEENAGITSLAAAAAHAHGVCVGDLAALELAAKTHQDLWAHASANEDIGALLAPSDRDQAVRHLDEAGAAYQAIGAHHDAARIRRRLRQLGTVRRHWKRSGGPENEEIRLTDTERKVAELVAEGMTNQQVARSMYISPHTVAFHLRQIYRKLQIHSRVELTRRLHSGAS
nr:StaR-like transcriptional regulator [uncultured bacterium]